MRINVKREKSVSGVCGGWQVASRGCKRSPEAVVIHVGVECVENGRCVRAAREGHDHDESHERNHDDLDDRDGGQIHEDQGNIWGQVVENQQEFPS